MEKGTPNGTTPELDGEYTLVVKNPEAVLLFSYIGYIRQEIQVNNRSVLDITLQTKYCKSQQEPGKMGRIAPEKIRAFWSSTPYTGGGNIPLK